MRESLMCFLERLVPGTLVGSGQLRCSVDRHGFVLLLPSSIFYVDFYRYQARPAPH